MSEWLGQLPNILIDTDKSTNVPNVYLSVVNEVNGVGLEEGR